MNTADQHININAKAGENFEVNLTSTPGTGAIWYPAPAPDGLTLLQQDTTPQSSAIGGSATQRFVYRADRPGAYTLNFERKRVWEPQVRSRAVAAVQID